MKKSLKNLSSIFYNLSIYYSIIGFLSILALLGLRDFGFSAVWQIGVSVAAAVVSGVFFDYLEQKKVVLTPGPFISGLIIGLVGRFGEQFFVLILISIFAMASKFFFKLYGRHVLNPAAAGLFLGMVILGSFPAWWGGSSYPLVFYIWIAGLLLKFKRWAPLAGFIIPAISTGGPAILWSGSFLFFSTVMLIEPMTSPIKKNSGFIYGIFISLGFFVFSRFTTLDPLIPSLLLGNFVGRVLDRHI